MKTAEQNRHLTAIAAEINKQGKGAEAEVIVMASAT